MAAARVHLQGGIAETSEIACQLGLVRRSNMPRIIISILGRLLDPWRHADFLLATLHCVK